MMTKPRDYILTGQGNPVVLLHSSLSSKTQWVKLISALSVNHQVLAIDLLGYGQADTPNYNHFTFEQEINRVLTLIDTLLGNRGIHVFGHSYGGVIALRLCHDRPTRIQSMTLFEPAAFYFLPYDDPLLSGVVTMYQHFANLLEQQQFLEAARFFINHWSGEGYFEKLPKRFQQTLAKQSTKVLADFKASRQGLLTLQDYQLLNTPTLILTGEQSPVVLHSVSKLLHRHLINSTLLALDCGHMGPITDSAKINQLFIEFIHSDAIEIKALSAPPSTDSEALCDR